MQHDITLINKVVHHVELPYNTLKQVLISFVETEEGVTIPYNVRVSVVRDNVGNQKAVLDWADLDKANK